VYLSPDTLANIDKYCVRSGIPVLIYVRSNVKETRIVKVKRMVF
jgi:hypothetical protein